MFLEHINFTVSDLDRSLSFYGDLLDLKVRWQGTTNDGRPAAHLGDPRSYLALFQAASPGTTSVDYEQVGLNHFGFVVDDLEAVRRRLGALGIEAHLEADYEPGRRLYFYDPDGIEVELVEYGPS